MENIKCRLRPRHRISRNADQLHFWAHGYELIVSRLRLPGGQWVVVDNMMPVRIGRAFFAGPYRGKQVVLSQEGGCWVCTIDDTTHAGHTAIGALKGWFAIWGHHSHGQCSASAHACPYVANVRGDRNPEYCNCCERCTDECRRDV